MFEGKIKLKSKKIFPKSIRLEILCRYSNSILACPIYLMAIATSYHLYILPAFIGVATVLNFVLYTYFYLPQVKHYQRDNEEEEEGKQE